MLASAYLLVFCVAFANAAARAGSGDWREATLKSDNDLRKRHGSDPFTLNDELNSGAQAWATEQANLCSMKHDENRAKVDNTYVGENIWSGFTSGEYTAVQVGGMASKSWYCEIVNYRFANGKKTKFGDCAPKKKSTGHFTQTVWAGTKQVGYGFAYNPDCDNGKNAEGEDKPKGKYVFVGRYLPGGNNGDPESENVKYPN